MAIFHASCKPICRSKGQNIIKRSAYLSCKKLIDKKNNKIYNYLKKQDYISGGIIFPNNININISSQELWNMAEAAERRKDSRVGREWEISLPYELNENQRKTLAEDITINTANKYNIACEYTLNIPSKKGDQRNYRLHILTTTRQITQEGTLSIKSEIELSSSKAIEMKIPNSKQQIIDMSKMIADTINKHLKLANIDASVSHLSYKDRGIDLLPGIQKGRVVIEMERRGIVTEVGKIAEGIKEENRQIQQLKEQINNDSLELSAIEEQLTDLSRTDTNNQNN